MFTQANTYTKGVPTIQNLFKNEQMKNIATAKLPYALLFLALFALFVSPAALGVWGDEFLYADKVRQYGFIQFSIIHYNTWTSRTLIELVLGLFAVLPTICFSVMNALLCTLAAYSTNVLVNSQKKYMPYFICTLFLALNYLDFSNAGWIATSANYVWTAALGLYALVPFMHFANGKKPKVLQLIAATFALVYSVNMEQNLLFHGFFIAGYLIYNIINKQKIYKFIFVHIAAFLASVLYIMLSPGIAARYENDIVTNFGDWEMRSTLQNIELAISSSCRQFVFMPHLLFAFFTLMLAIIVFQNNKNIFYRLICLAPAVITFTFGFYGEQISSLLPILNFIPQSVTQQGIITVQNSTNFLSHIPFLILCALLSTVIISLYLAFGHSKKAAIAVFVFCTCYSTLAAIGFSPTVWGSAKRTTFVFCLGLIYLCAMLFNNLKVQNKFKYAAFAFLGIYTVLNYINILQN